MANESLLLLLRLSGKRLLAQLKASDFISTVAIGSILSNIFITKPISLANGVLCFIVLTGLQLLVSWLACVFPAFRKAAHAKPRLLFLKAVHGKGNG